MKPRCVGIQIIVSTKLNNDELDNAVSDFIHQVDESNVTDMSFVHYMTKKQIGDTVEASVRQVQLKNKS